MPEEVSAEGAGSTTDTVLVKREFLDETKDLFIEARECLNRSREVLQWANSIGKLFHEELLTDCCIKIDTGVTLKAHKCILAANSPLFKSMFESGKLPLLLDGAVAPSEGVKAVIEITGFSVPCVLEALRYCYNGHLSTTDTPARATKGDEELSVELFRLDGKYEIQALRELLEDRFTRALSVGNVVKMALLAHDNGSRRLEHCCVQLTAREAKAILDSDEWKRLEVERPDFAFQLAKEALRVASSGCLNKVVDPLC